VSFQRLPGSSFDSKRYLLTSSFRFRVNRGFSHSSSILKWTVINKISLLSFSNWLQRQVKKKHFFVPKWYTWCKYLNVIVDVAFVIDKYLWTNEGTIWGDTFRFDSFISHLVEYIEIVQNLKGIFPNLILSNVMAVLLNFRPIPMYLPKKSAYGISTWNFAYT
jgi:hypothetical protein